MAKILRGDIYWADLNPVIGSEQGGFRPVLILSHDIFNKNSGTVIAMAITGQPQRAGFPLTFELSKTKLPKRSWVKISQIRTLSIKRIREKIVTVSPEELGMIIEGLNEIIDGQQDAPADSLLARR
ncbi:MAG: type II toxin-antitoxin system PemK/MazF family toxin [Thermodesulfobacteriota bacterium]|nr:type II toxin-antitoxin system PemK/MazF family toxin [Deltaproteobacteria bacterium]RKX56797.1 MAG: type II toxin-antitoxin system PemK/MazF family toxin [Thermodesulfobacteriota bacterium]